MKVLVLGSSGIIGQHMRLCVPSSVTPIWHRHEADDMHVGCDIGDAAKVAAFLDANPANVIVNLAGKSDTDAVERNPKAAERLNVYAVGLLAEHCKRTRTPLIQVSSQAVFRGDAPPYSPDSECNPVNSYGEQKQQAEEIALKAGGTVIRPTFVLGVRPMQWGRPNPVEQMMAGQRKQVNDRWFSPLFADDAAKGIWSAVVYGSDSRIVHLGNPQRMSRYDVAVALGQSPEGVMHDSFIGLAPRPMDTTYATGRTGFSTAIPYGIARLRSQWQSRQSMDVSDRAREISIFLGRPEDECHERLKKGFGFLHGEVTRCFNLHAPKDDTKLLNWYRTTEAYIWELSAYHCDLGFNYTGMCQGVADHLRVAGAKRVLVLGDGIGSFTIALRRAGLDATYHDLNGSRTADFARFRLARHTGTAAPLMLTGGWEPNINGGPYDAIVCADFLEHVPNVEAWVRAIRGALHSGGLLFSQNGFAMGSGSNGSMPMHLARNDRYEKEWDPMLSRLAFTQDSSNWYRAAA